MANREEALKAFREWLDQEVEDGVTQQSWIEVELTYGSPADAFYELTQAFIAGYCVSQNQTRETK